MQDELRALELQLHRMDQFDAEHRATYLKTRELDDDLIGDRGKLMGEIAKKLKEYGMLTSFLFYPFIFLPVSTVFLPWLSPGDGVSRLATSTNLGRT